MSVDQNRSKQPNENSIQFLGLSGEMPNFWVESGRFPRNRPIKAESYGELCRIVRYLGTGIAMNEFGATAAQRGATRLSLFELALVLVRLDHVACRIVNADHSIVSGRGGGV